MERLKPGSEVWIQSYKHDGSLHRTWCKAFVLEENEEAYVVVTNKAWVIEADGRRWFTREPAVYVLFKRHWFNVISMIRKAGVFYYCNLATPSLYDGEAIKNIDYDLDVKLYPDWSYQILDEDEFHQHAQAMHYSARICETVQKQMQILLKKMETEAFPFQEEYVWKYYRLYQKMNRSER